MKKTYVVQLIIDAVVIFLGMCNYFFPSIVRLSLNTTFYLMMSVYAGLELCEYIFDHSRKEPLYLFLASSVCAFSGLFLRNYPENYVLSITVAVWTLMISIIKTISLEEIYHKKTNLFMIRLIGMASVVLIGITVSINMYYKVTETIVYMLGFLYMGYGIIELSCDFLSYLSEDSKFLKE